MPYPLILAILIIWTLATKTAVSQFGATQCPADQELPLDIWLKTHQLATPHQKSLDMILLCAAPQAWCPVQREFI